MPKVTEVPANELIENAAERLEKMNEFKPPEWSTFAKTGSDRERPPEQENWWWLRSASVLRKIYLRQSSGVSRLRKVYGSRKNNGHQPEHKGKASGSVIRKILQQLEAAGFVKLEKGKGRKITAKGSAFLKEVAAGK